MGGGPRRAAKETLIFEIKTQVEPRAAGAWLNCKALNILITVKTMENSFRFVPFHYSCSWEIACYKEKTQIAPP